LAQLYVLEKGWELEQILEGKMSLISNKTQDQANLTSFQVSQPVYLELFSLSSCPENVTCPTMFSRKASRRSAEAGRHAKFLL